MANDKKTPFGIQILKAIGVVVALAAIILFMNFLGMKQAWIPLLGLTIWGMLGLSMDVKTIISIWLGGFVALFAAFSIGWASMQFGPVGYVIPGVLVFTLFFHVINDRTNIVFNLPCAIFITAATGMPNGITISCWKELLFGFVIFGIIPIIAGKVMAKKAANKKVPQQIETQAQ